MIATRALAVAAAALLSFTLMPACSSDEDGGSSPTPTADGGGGGGNGSDGGAAGSDGGAPSGATCGGRTEDPTAPASTVSGSGNVLHDGKSVSAAALQSGYAVRAPNGPDGSEEIRLYLHTFANACGRLRGGMAKKDDAFVAFGLRSAAGTKLTARAYPSVALEVSAVKENPVGTCTLPQSTAAGGPRGTVTVTAIDDTRVVGTIAAAPASGPADPPSVTVDFSVPFCAATTAFKPPLCCIP